MSGDRVELAREIVQQHVPPAMAGVVLDLLQHLPSPTATSSAPDPMLTAQEVANRLGSPGRPVHPTTVYRLMDRGELREQRVGRQRRVRLSELERYLAANDRLAQQHAPRQRVLRRSEDELRVRAENQWLEEIG